MYNKFITSTSIPITGLRGKRNVSMQYRHANYFFVVVMQ